MKWQRDGAGWLLLYGRRRMGRVVPDAQYPGMWRSVLERNRPSDMANLSCAKNAVLKALLTGDPMTTQRDLAKSTGLTPGAVTKILHRITTKAAQK